MPPAEAKVRGLDRGFDCLISRFKFKFKSIKPSLLHDRRSGPAQSPHLLHLRSLKTQIRFPSDSPPRSWLSRGGLLFLREAVTFLAVFDFFGGKEQYL